MLTEIGHGILSEYPKFRKCFNAVSDGSFSVLEIISSRGKFSNTE